MMTKLEQMFESKSSHYRSNKLELAARQALELLWERGPLFSAAEDKAITALREALAEQAEQEPQHSERYWLHEINNARADGYERGYKAGKTEKSKIMQIALDVIESEYTTKGTNQYDPLEVIRTMHKYINETEQTTHEQAEQEPVAWSQQRKRNLIKHWAFDCDWGDLTERQIDDLELIINAVLNAAPLAQQITPVTQAVRTKDPCNPLQDLTDDEISTMGCAIYGDTSVPEVAQIRIEFARAVIAADREKNRV